MEIPVVFSAGNVALLLLDSPQNTHDIDCCRTDGIGGDESNTALVT